MTAAPKIAIVIPIFNEATTLSFLLAGIAEQTLAPNEVIVIDSGSKDTSVAIVEKWAADNSFGEERFRVIANSGGMPGANRNRGITAAKSEWIAFIDAGIVPSSNWLACLWSCAEKTQAKAIFGLCHFEAERPFEKAVCSLSYGCTATHPVLPASLFHRSVFNKVGLFREDLRTAEDVLWMRAVEQAYGPKMICESALVYYRHFPTNVSAVIRKWWVSSQHAIQAGIYSWKIWFLPGFFVMIIMWLVIRPIMGVSLLSTYILMRGVLNPMRRSHSFAWWGGNPSSALIAMWLCFVIDITKSLSILFSWVRRLK